MDSYLVTKAFLSSSSETSSVRSDIHMENSRSTLPLVATEVPAAAWGLVCVSWNLTG